MNKGNLLLLLCASTSLGLAAMDMSSAAYQILLKQKIKEETTVEGVTDLVRMPNNSSAIQLNLGSIGFSKFKQGDWSTETLKVLTECFAEDLVPFVFDHRPLSELPTVIQKYPGVDINVIRTCVSDIQAGKSIRSKGCSDQVLQAARFREFVADETGNNNLWTGKNYLRDRWNDNPRIALRIKLAGVLVVACGIAYGIYRVFFAKKAVVEDESEDDLEENDENKIKEVAHEQA